MTLQAHLVLESIPAFRLISYWIRVLKLSKYCFGTLKMNGAWRAYEFPLHQTLGGYPTLLVDSTPMVQFFHAMQRIANIFPL